MSPKNDNGERQIVDALLKGEIAIDRHKCIELASTSGEQRAIPNARPSKPNDGGDIMGWDFAREPTINAFVE